MAKKNRQQDISPIKLFSFVNLKNEFHAFLGWPYYILEKLTILYAMFSFLGFFSLSKKESTIHAQNTHTSKQTSKSKISTHTFRRIFRILSTSINEILLDAQIKEYNTELSTTPNT